MKRFIITLIIALFASPAVANEWYPLAASRTHEFDLLKDSFRSGNGDRNGAPLIYITIRAINKSTRIISLERNYVTIEDCQDGYGKLVSTDLNGRVLYADDFMFGAGNVAARIAEVICSAEHKSQPTRRSQPGVNL